MRTFRGAGLFDFHRAEVNGSTVEDDKRAPTNSLLVLAASPAATDGLRSGEDAGEDRGIQGAVLSVGIRRAGSPRGVSHRIPLTCNQILFDLARKQNTVTPPRIKPTTSRTAPPLYPTLS